MFMKECIGDLCHLPGVHPLAVFSGGCLICDRSLSMRYLKELVNVEKVIFPTRSGQGMSALCYM